MTIDSGNIRRDLYAATSFMLTQEHLTLLRNANVTWDDGECGAPVVDPKRPYGNGNVAKDVARLLEWTMDGDEMSDAMAERAERLHSETALALQVCLSLGTFKTGRYERAGGYGEREWRLVEVTP